MQADNSTKEGTPKGKVNLKNSALLIKGDSNIETSVEDAKNNVSIKLKKMF